MLPRIHIALQQLESIILGKPRALQLAVSCLLARGHLLIEDVPGVGKTTLARALAQVLGLEMRRIQFTSDLLPADIVGNSIFDREKGTFVFHPGPLFAPMILADEVNRATPKTQSALLEAMEEGQVTVDGITHSLPKPFFVIATQNPHFQIGTYPLPESQLDRFLMRMDLGFPDRAAEKMMLTGPDRRELTRQIEPVLTANDLIEWQQKAGQIHVSDPILNYILDLLERTRSDAKLAFGLSPRAGLALRRAAQAWALLEGREMVLPEDVQSVAEPVLAHRLEHVQEISGQEARTRIRELVESVNVP